jgi:oligopeptidase B
MQKSVVVLFLLMSTFLQADDKPAAAATGTTPPVAKKIHTENHINGGTLVDDYQWMREKSNPEVAQYLEAENAYADSVMKSTAALRQKLYDEMVSHIKETDVNVPYKQGD